MLRVVIVGLGAIGLACARAVQAEQALTLAGLVDADPLKVGKTLAELGARRPAEAQEPLDDQAGPVITDQLEEALENGADVAILATASRFDVVAPSIRTLLRHRVAVVSSCEEMAWPWYRHAALADQLDAEAQAAGCAVLGTGVNPGFVMDKLPVVFSSMVRRVTAVRCVRRVDAGMRRRPLQAKVGATMKVIDFELKARQRQIGHAGLAESVAMIAAGLGRSAAPGAVVETLEPVVAQKPTPSALGLIQPGFVAGIHNVARWNDETLSIELDLTMAVGLEDTKDVVCLDGPVQLRLKIPGSLPGDSATVAVLLNHIPVVHEAKAGLRTMLDVPPAGCRNYDMMASES